MKQIKAEPAYTKKKGFLMKRILIVLILVVVFCFFGCRPSEESADVGGGVSVVEEIEEVLRRGAAIEVMEEELGLGAVMVRKK